MTLFIHVHIIRFGVVAAPAGAEEDSQWLYQTRGLGGFVRPCRGGIGWGQPEPRVPLRSTRGNSPQPLRGQDVHSRKLPVDLASCRRGIDAGRPTAPRSCPFPSDILLAHRFASAAANRLLNATSAKRQPARRRIPVLGRSNGRRRCNHCSDNMLAPTSLGRHRATVWTICHETAHLGRCSRLNLLRYSCL